MIAHPAVVVHGLDDALAALSPGLPVLLLSAPNAAAFMGCLWWRALVDAARRASPDTETADALDCGDSPGYAMAALREGQRILILDPACPAFPAVRNAATRLFAAVWPRRPAALDLAQCGAVRRLADWLQSGTQSQGESSALDPPKAGGLWKPNGFQRLRL
jgi:hypothetical protein